MMNTIAPATTVERRRVPVSAGKLGLGIAGTIDQRALLRGELERWLARQRQIGRRRIQRGRIGRFRARTAHFAGVVEVFDRRRQRLRKRGLRDIGRAARWVGAGHFGLLIVLVLVLVVIDRRRLGRDLTCGPSSIVGGSSSSVSELAWVGSAPVDLCAFRSYAPAMLSGPLAILAVLTSAPSLSDENLTVSYQNLLAGRLNAKGLVNALDLSARYRLYDSDSAALEQNFVGVTVGPRITPAFFRLAAALEIQPLSILRLFAQVEWGQFFGSFDLLQSYESPQADWSSTAQDLGEGYATNGYQVTLGGLFQIKLGPIGARFKANAVRAELILQNDHSLFYDLPFDILMENGQWLYSHDADVVYITDFGLSVGARHTLTIPRCRAPTPRRITASARSRRIRFSKTKGRRCSTSRRSIAILGWYLDHRFRTGLDHESSASIRRRRFSLRRRSVRPSHCGHCDGLCTHIGIGLLIGQFCALSGGPGTSLHQRLPRIKPASQRLPALKKTTGLPGLAPWSPCRARGSPGRAARCTRPMLRHPKRLFVSWAVTIGVVVLIIVVAAMDQRWLNGDAQTARIDLSTEASPTRLGTVRFNPAPVKSLRSSTFVSLRTKTPKVPGFPRRFSAVSTAFSKPSTKGRVSTAARNRASSSRIFVSRRLSSSVTPSVAINRS